MEGANGVYKKTVDENNVITTKNGLIQTKENLANDETNERWRVRVYKQRWLMLALFCLVSMSNAMQWIQYSVISNVVKDFYDVSQLAVDWFSMIYMLAYIPLILPGTWLLDHSGLRLIGVLAASLNCLGAWLKYVGARPDLFGLAFAGQTVTAIAQVFILGMPAHVAATWFGAEQVSTACAIGVFGNQVRYSITDTASLTIMFFHLSIYLISFSIWLWTKRTSAVYCCKLYLSYPDHQLFIEKLTGNDRFSLWQ